MANGINVLPILRGGKPALMVFGSGTDQRFRPYRRPGIGYLIGSITVYVTNVFTAAGGDYSASANSLDGPIV
jgi:hypothetical protein